MLLSCRLLLALTTVVLLTACDAPDPGVERAPAYPSAMAPEERHAGGDALKLARDNPDEADAARDHVEERRNYQLHFETADALVAAYQAAHESCRRADDCHVEQGRLQTPRHAQAHARLVMRIAREQLATAEPLKLVAESPAVAGVEITRTDRSRQVIDTRARLEQQIVLRDRLRELAQEGRGFSERRIQDLLQVERELARVQGEIESMQGRQQHLAQVTETVAVSAEFQEQRWVGPHEHGIMAPLWRALDRSATLFFESVGQVILVVVFLTPWLVLGVPALWLLSRLWRPLRRGWSRLRRREPTARS